MSGMTVERILAKLEAQVELHRARIAFHADQRAFHEEQGTIHTAELEKLAPKLAAFRASATGLDDVLVEPPPEAGPGLGTRSGVSRLVGLVVESFPPGTPFTARDIAAEINRYHGRRLARPVDGRIVGTTLRRLRDAGQIRPVQEGKPHHEAVYSR